MIFKFFERQIDPLEEHPVEQPPESTREFFTYFIKPYKWVLLITLILAGVAAVSELFLYTFLGQLVDWMSGSEREDLLSRHGLSLIGMVLVAAVIRPLALLSSRAYINLALAPGIANSIRWKNHRYVLRQSLSFYQNDFAGRVAQKVLQTGNAVREAVLNLIDGVWLMVIYLIGIGYLFAGIDTLLLWPVILWIFFYGMVIYKMVPPVRTKSAALSEATSVLTGRIVDSYTNIQSVKLFAHTRFEEEFAAEGIRKHTVAFRTLMRSILRMTVALTILNTFLLVGTACLSVYLWMEESVSLGDIAIANGLIIRLNHMSGWILRTVTSLFENVGMVQNGMETISKPLTVVDKPNAKSLVVDGGEIEFRNVSFNYGADISVVEDCSLKIRAGEKVGLVGRSGAGKSTLINLLMRFHDLQYGCITIDHQDISNVSQNSLRSSIAVVTQDTSLMHRSIRDNIRYGKPGATEAMIVNAARQAEAMQFIPDLDDSFGKTGLDAMVGERGVKLSGGQRQRIAIARVLLKDAPILVLDEATSALDSEVEAAIQKQLTQLMASKTVIAVAHRLSTIAALDRLVVLDEGKIVEEGSHAELLKLEGLYANLWHRQSGGFLPTS